MYCRICGQEVPAGAKECPSCGVPEELYAPRKLTREQPEPTVEAVPPQGDYGREYRDDRAYDAPRYRGDLRAKVETDYADDPYPQQTKQIPRKPVKKGQPKWLIPAIAAGVTLVLLIVLLVVFISTSGDDPEPVPTESTIDTQETTEPTEPTEPERGSLAEVAAEFLDADGYVAPERYEDALNAVYDAAKDMDGVSDCYLERNSLYIDMESGLDYIYVPPMRGVDAGSGELSIQILRPDYTKQERSDASNGGYDLKGADNAVSMLKSWDGRWQNVGVSTLANSDSTLDALLHLERSSVILLHGHGAYHGRIGSLLGTGVIANDEMLGRYRQINERTAVQGLNHEIFLRKEFFDEAYGSKDLQNAFIYLAACYSGSDTGLADVLLNKGAAVVVTNEGGIHRDYNLTMMGTILDSFFSCGTSKTSRELAGKTTDLAAIHAKNWTVQDSLKLAKAAHGTCDPQPVRDNHGSVTIRTRQGSLSYPGWMAGFPDAVGEPPVKLAFNTELILPLVEFDEKKTNPDLSDTKAHSYRIPELQLCTKDADAVNAEIQKTYLGSEKWLTDGVTSATYGKWQNVDYAFFINEDILSLRIKSRTSAEEEWNQTIYNFSTVTGKRLSDSELLKAAGWTEDKFQKAVKEVLLSYYWDKAWPWMENSVAEKDRKTAEQDIKDAEKRFNDTLKLCGEAKPYLGADRVLCATGWYYDMSLTGADGAGKLCSTYDKLDHITRSKHYSDTFQSPALPEDTEKTRTEAYRRYIKTYKPESGFALVNAAAADVTGDGLPELVVVTAADDAFLCQVYVSPFGAEPSLLFSRRFDSVDGRVGVYLYGNGKGYLLMADHIETDRQIVERFTITDGGSASLDDSLSFRLDTAARTEDDQAAIDRMNQWLHHAILIGRDLPVDSDGTVLPLPDDMHIS